MHIAHCTITNPKEKQRKMSKNGIKCHVKGGEKHFASNIHTQSTCKQHDFLLSRRISIFEEEKKYEQLLPFYYLLRICKSDSFISLHFSNFCSLNAQTQIELELKEEKKCILYPFSYASLGISKRIHYYVFILPLIRYFK